MFLFILDFQSFISHCSFMENIFLVKSNKKGNDEKM